jgi:thymidylate kinase
MAVAEPGRFTVIDATAPADEVAARIEHSVERLVGGPRSTRDKRG